MPTVRIEMLPGRTDEQKHRLVESVTEAVIESLSVDRAKVRVELIEAAKGG